MRLIPRPPSRSAPLPQQVRSLLPSRRRLYPRRRRFPPVPSTQTPLPTSTPLPTATTVPPTETPVPTESPAPTATPAPTEAHAIALVPAANAITLDNADAVKSLHVLQGHTDRVLSVAYSPDGDLIVSGGGEDDRAIRIWDAQT